MAGKWTSAGTYATSGVADCPATMRSTASARAAREGTLAAGEQVHFFLPVYTGTAPIERVEIHRKMGQCVWQGRAQRLGMWKSTEAELPAPEGAWGFITICGCGNRTGTGRG